MSEAIKLFGKTIPLPDCDSDGDGEEALSCERQSNSKQLTSKKARDRNETALTDDSSKTPTADTDSTESPEPKTDDKQNDTINPQDKPLKKPDKILPCPRCNSMDTKFCYYNNYNVSQPRHFCKNCQRYWTAGGTMRNVPVGAGRRKNKNPASQFRHVIAPDAPVKPNGSLLTFGSVLKNQNCAPETLENCKKEINLIQNTRCYCPSQLPFFAVPPWVAPQGVIPMPFYPAPPYWGCYPMQPPWVNSAINTNPSSLTLGKHCREEHTIRQSEDEEEEERERRGGERSLWVPKTLRIDDPGEAAKSSIWATLGINREKCDFADGGRRKGSLFKAFHSKGDEKSDSSNTSPSLQANPAALSRSRNFHESS